MNEASRQGEERPWCESMSCLVDGELGEEEARRLMAALCADPELRTEWISFHVVGDALRSSEVAAAHSMSFCERVAAAIAHEPTVLAPRSIGVLRQVRRFAIPTLAVAASVAVIGYVAVPMLQPTGSAPVQQAAVRSLPAPAPVAEPSRRAASTVANARALDAYLVAHRELGSGVALPRAMPYLRSTAEATDGR
jgi:sigma-E factor negative regulatory protein RseA